MSKPQRKRLTGIFEKGVCPGRPIPEEKPPAPLTPTVECKRGQIVCRPLIVSGPVRLFVVDGPELPPELLERLIVISDDPEDSPCP